MNFQQIAEAADVISAAYKELEQAKTTNVRLQDEVNLTEQLLVNLVHSLHGPSASPDKVVEALNAALSHLAQRGVGT